MTKKVHVEWTSGGSNDYKGVAKIEEDRHYEHVTGWRLYGEHGDLIAMIKHDIVSYIEVNR